MNEYTIKVNEAELEAIIRGIHMQYLKYSDGYDDEDVYEFNSDLDKVLIAIKAQIEAQHNNKDEEGAEIYSQFKSIQGWQLLNQWC